jgi:hypothetical protein
MIPITTNNVPRDVIDAWELSTKERAEFEYLDWKAIEEGHDSASFFRYKGQVYDLGEFTWHPDSIWDGIQHDSHFSGIVVRYVDDYERVIVGRYCV